MNKLKLLIVAALMAAIILPCSVFAAEEEEPVEKPKDPEVVELVEDQEEDQANEESRSWKLIVSRKCSKTSKSSRNCRLSMKSKVRWQSLIRSSCTKRRS